MLNLYLFFTISKKERYEVSTRWQTDSTCLNPDSSYPECRHWSYFQASKKKPPEYCKIAGKASFHLTIYFILQSILYRMPLTGRGDSSRNSSASPGHALRGAPCEYIHRGKIPHAAAMAVRQQLKFVRISISFRLTHLPVQLLYILSHCQPF